jgi:predicted glycoside hydrolase/deacetylase ChbG (UPF0249 family)
VGKPARSNDRRTPAPAATPARGPRLGLTLAGAALALAPLVAAAAPPQTVQERLGHPASARLLVIHADDLGMSHSVNRATFEALERRWITSASILVPCPWFPEVVRWARTHQDADLGIHLALNSEWTTFRWGPIASKDAIPSLLDPDGYLPIVEEIVVEHAKPPEIERELRAQVDKAKSAGIPISHLDSHMATLFRTKEFFGVYHGLSAAYGLPILVESDTDARRIGAVAPGEALVNRVLAMEPGVAPKDWLKAYQDMLRPLPPGVYQLIVHLAYDDPEMQGATADHPDYGAAWRQSDLDLVKSDAFRAFLKEQKFVLVGWKDLARAR